MIEQDRYQQSPKLYVLGMVMLMLCLLFLLLAFYIFPFLVWDFYYDVPEFIIALEQHLMEYYQFSEPYADAVTFLIFFIPGILCGLISWWVSNRIDNAIIDETNKKEMNSVPLSEAPKKEETVSLAPIAKEATFATKVIIAMIIALAILFSVEWLISVPPPAG